MNDGLDNPADQPSLADSMKTSSITTLSGLVAGLHAVPFQWMIVPNWPTAQPSLPATISMARQLGLFGAFEGTGPHVAPFQCSIMSPLPTAHRSFGPVPSML